MSPGINLSYKRMFANRLGSFTINLQAPMHVVPQLFIWVWTTFVASQDSGLRVQTQQGDVIGSLVTPTVRQFLGIPYAVAGRWEAPKLPSPRQELFKADHYGDSCIQMNNAAYLEFLKLTSFAVPNVTESESCMSINIWSPSVDRKQKTAVMIWIHGGGFQIGTVGLLSLLTKRSESLNYLNHRATFQLTMVNFSYGTMTTSLWSLLITGSIYLANPTPLSFRILQLVKRFP